MTTHDPDLAKTANGRGKAKAPRGKMKEDKADLDVKAGAFRVVKSELKGFCERVEAIETEMAELREALKEVYAEAQGRGYSVKSLKTVVKERKRDRDDVIAEREVTDLYRDQLGLL